MNKNLHRIIFNARRGQLMVVCETASGQGKGASGERAGGSCGDAPALSVLRLALAGALGLWVLAQTPSYAQIVADPSAPRSQQAIILQTANGSPQVNIQTPSAAGVSRNTYIQFDVNQRGAILNNSRANVATQTGGFIQGNPYLATGSARVILNEVNSSNPSQLRGYVEIAGQRAEVIIANPAGINIDSTGFINASRVTLTTGTPVINGGNLESYRVQGGNISINGQGLDVRDTDYTGILARAVQVNAGIWAKDLKVVTGSNVVDVSHTAIVPIAGTGAAPTFALDVAQLGGMYAGKIFLVGTEAGVGTRNSGTVVATSGKLVLQANGWLTNTGTLQAQGAVQVQTVGPVGGITNSGSIISRDELQISGAQALDNRGGTISAPRLDVMATGLVNRAGVIEQIGSQALNVQGLSLSNAAGGKIGEEAASASNASARNAAVAARSYAAGSLAISGALNNDAGRINATGGIALTSQSGLNNDGGTLNLKQLLVTGDSLSRVSNNGGTLRTQGDLRLQTGQIDNQSGSITAGGQLQITASGVNNAAGSMTQNSVAATRLTVTGSFNNNAGTVNTDGDLALTSANLVNSQGRITSGQNTTLTTQGAGNSFDNTDGQVVSNQTLNINTNATGNLLNTRGTLQASGGSLSFNGGDLSNSTGRVFAAADMTLQAANISSASGGSVYAAGNQTTTATAAVSNAGFMGAQGNTTIIAAGLSSAEGSVIGAGVKADGTQAANGDLSITTAQGLTANGQVLAVGNATLGGTSVNLAGSRTSAANIRATASSGDITTTAAVLSTPGTLSLMAKANNNQSLNNNASGSGAGGTLSAGLLKLEVANLNNQGGQIIQTGAQASDITLTSPTGVLNNSAGGSLGSNGQTLTLGTATLNNTSGAIAHAGTGTLVINANSFLGVAGQIISNGALLINAGSINFDSIGAANRAATQASQISINATSLNNNASDIVQTGTGATRLNITGILGNARGTISSNGNTAIDAASLGNSQGAIQAKGASTLIVTTAGVLDNAAGGQIGAGGSATINAGTLINNSGKITAGSTLNATVQGAASSIEGLIAANDALTLNAANLNNTSGTLAAVRGNVSVATTGLINNDSGSIQAAGSIALSNAGLSNAVAIGKSVGGAITGRNVTLQTNAQTFNNSGGTVAASDTLTIDSGALTNDSGLIQSAGTGAGALSINTNGQTLTNTNAANRLGAPGGVTSQGTLTLATGDINNGAGFLGAKGGLAVSSANVFNTSGGKIVGESAINITSAGLDNRTGQIQALSNVTLDAGAGTVNNAGGLLRSAGTTAVSAASVTNTNTLGTNLGIEGANVFLTAISISNTSGAVRADNNATVTSSGALNNNSGLISAGNALTLQSIAPGKTLTIANTGGTFIAGQSLTVNAASLGGDGQVLSRGDLNIALTGSFNNSSQIIANGNVILSVAGTVTNSGKLQANNSLSVTASDIDNATTGAITAATTQVTAANSVLNRGLIDGQSSRINAGGTLANIGTGRIYGDMLSIAAGALTNNVETAGGITAAASIAARTQLDIGATSVNNQAGALIFSAGDISIGGALDGNRQATGRSATVSNNGATIQALGDLRITAQTINNSNAGFTYAVYDVAGPSETIYATGGGVYYASQGAVPATGPLAYYRTDGLNRPTFSLGALIRGSRGSTRPAQGPVAGSPVYGVIQYNTTEQRAVVTSSKPGVLTSGGATVLDASGQINNDMSQILAGGTLAITGSASINNIQNVIATTNTQRGFTYTWENFDSGGCGGLGSSCSRWTAFSQGGYYSAVGSSTTLEGNYASYTQTQAQGSVAARSGTLSLGNTSATSAATASAQSTAITQVTANVNNLAASNATAASSATAVAGQTNAAAVPSGSFTTPTGIRTDTPNLVIPTASLFHTNPDPTAHYLIETDPRFANYRNWLGSDFMVNAAGLDPNVTQKRLGDGFYEQRLIREQVANLTGRRFLGDYGSDEQQYQALLTSGVTYAKAYNLRPGIALNAEQMAQLTSDIVWLVEQIITLADGTTTKALVPQLYVTKIQPGDLDGSGALISGKQVNVRITGDLTNSGNMGGNLGGTVAGRTLVNINAANINNLAGRIQGTQVSLNATQDITNKGGSISAGSSLQLNAGRDINLVSTTTSNKDSGSVFTRTQLDRLAGVYVVGLGNTPASLSLSAGRDVNAQAASIANTSNSGPINIQVVRDLTLSTVSTDFAAATGGGANFFRMQSSQDAGTSISSQGNISLNAGNNLSATAANVQSSQGATSLNAGSSVSLTAGQKTYGMAWGSESKTSDIFSSSSTIRRETANSTQSVGTNVGGINVNITASQDINIQGSSVIADKDATLKAGNNVNILAATNTASSTSFIETKESGFLSGGGLGITFGKREQSLDQKSQSTTAASSTVGAITGNININAGQAYKQVGSDLVAPAGDINITARKIDIIEARQTSATQTEQKFKQSGLTVSISNPVLSALQSAQGIVQAAGNTSSGRMQALAGASIALQGYNTASSLTDTAGNFSPAAAADVKITASIGTSKSQSNSTSQSDTARGSSISGNNININATGAGVDSNLLIQGSTVKAANNATLTADNAITLQGATNQASSTNSSSSSSSSVGMSYSVLTGAVGFNASASKGQGSGNGQDTTYTNSQINAGNTATLQSGGNTTIAGAVVAANRIRADVAGNLNIQSLQDTSSYTSQQSNVGGSLSIGGGGITGGSINAGKSNINSAFQSTNAQSGLKAGDGGFAVNVGGNTDLKGSVIASTQAAVDANKNSFKTGGALTTSDIQNTASFSGTGYSVGASFSTSDVKDKQGNTSSKTTPGGSFGIGSDKGNASSTASAGISGIAGNTAIRSTDANTGLQRIFDAQKVQAEINAQVAITQAFSKEAPKAVGTFATNQAKELRSQGNEVEAKKWDEGGRYRVLLHTLAGTFSGGASGAAGAAVSASAAPLMNQFQDSLTQSLKDAGLGDKLAKGIASGVAGLTAAGAGAAVGGAAGAATAFTVDVNNRQLHPAEQSLAKQLAARAKAGGLSLSESDISAALRQAGIKGTNVSPDQTAVMTNPTSTDPNVPGARFDNLMPLLSNTGSALVENTVQASLQAIAFVLQATGGASSPYYWSTTATTPATVVSVPNTGGPQYYNCATTDCLLQGANRNPTNTQNQADAARAQNALMAAGLIVGAPVAIAYSSPVLFGMVATAQTTALVGGAGVIAPLAWGKTAVVGAAFGGAFEFLINPEASPASLVVASAGGAIGGAAKLGLNATFGLPNQWVPTTLANFGTAVAGSQILGGAAKANLNSLGDSTSGASWWTSPVSSCGIALRKPC